MKFGGTSIGTAKAMRQAISIVAHQEQESTPLVVLSACSGITNKLLRIADASGNGSLDDALALAGEVRAHHLGLVDELLTG